MSVYGKKEKVCGTCLFWKGKRQVEFKFVNDIDCEGKCSCEAAFCGVKTTDGSYCSNWQGFFGAEEKQLS